jgi:hypothetical protein
MTDMTNWMEDEEGFQSIPHKNGKIKWFVMSFEMEGGRYVGEYDMTDWDKTFDEVVFPKAQEMANGLNTDEWRLIRGDQLSDLMFNVANCLQSADVFKRWWLPISYYDDDFDEENDND